MSRNERASIAADDRAYVPFAVIGVFLLLTSVTVVAVLETRSDPEIDTDPTQAFDRTSSAVQSSMQSAVTDGLQDAAAEPVTEANTSTAVGQAIDASTDDETFSRYAKLRVYATARERLPAAGQQVHDIETEVTVPDYDPQQVLDNVTMQVGGLPYGDPGGTDLPNGSVRVTIPDVEIAVREGNATIARRTEDYTTTVGSTAFLLHDRTEAYEDALDANLSDADGVARQLSARLNRIGWQRGHAQADGAPLAEVVGDRHLEPIANDAIYATQRATFGESDSYRDRALTRAYGCMLAEDHHDVYDDPTNRSADLGPVLDRAADPGFCDGANATYADLGGTLSGATAPEYAQLAGENHFLEGTDRLDLSGPSNATMGDLTTDEEIEAAIQRAYEVDVGVDHDVERTILPLDPGGRNTELRHYDVTVDRPERLIEPDGTGREREYYRVPIHFSGWYTRGGVPTSVRYDVNLTVRGEHSPDQRVDQRGVETDYEQGPRGAGDVLYGTNYRGVPDQALEAALAGVDDANAAGRQLEEHLEANADGVLSAADLVDVATVSGGDVTVQQTPNRPDALRAWLLQDLRALDRNLSAVSTTYERHELVDGTDPIDDLRRAVDDDGRWVYTHVGSGQYRNVPDLARAEARLAYLETLRGRIERSRDRHQQVLDDVEAGTRARSGANLSDVTALTRAQLNGSYHDPAPNAPESDILTDVTLVPHSQPGYLTFERVDATELPATDGPAPQFAPTAVRHGSNFSAPYDRSLPGSSLVPSATTVQLRTAGEVLRAGRAADAHAPPGWAGGGHVDALNASLDRWLDATSNAAAREAAAPFPTLDRRQLDGAIRAELRSVGPVHEQAIRLSSDPDAVDRVAGGVADRFKDGSHPDYRHWRGDRRVHLQTAVRSGLHHALDEGYVDRPTATDTRQLADALRSELGDRDEAARRERRAQAASDGLSNDTATATTSTWFESELSNDTVAPNAVSAGLTTTNLPEWQLLDLNLWTVDLEGEYARFSVRSTGSRATGRHTEYVREDGEVSVDVGAGPQRAGRTEALTVDAQTVLLVAVAEDSLGVGDRTDSIVQCSDTYDVTGPIRTRGSVGGPCPGS